MKPQHAGSNYKWFAPFFRKMEQTGRNIFKAGLGGSRLTFENQNRSFGDYGQVYIIRYLNSTDKYYEVAINDVTRTVTPLRYYDRNAISFDNSVPDQPEINCFWFSWSNPCPRPDNLRKVDTMLHNWISWMENHEFYIAKYA